MANVYSPEQWQVGGDAGRPAYEGGRLDFAGELTQWIEITEIMTRIGVSRIEAHREISVYVSPEP